MKKFWTMKADESATADIFIYGDIVSGDKWQDSDTTSKSFADDLKKCGGKSVTVHINSGGGSVFDAMAIANTLKNYSGDVTISVEGLCASAATLVTCGSGGHVKAAENAIFMVHKPAAFLFGSYNEDRLKKVENSLTAVMDAVIATYAQKIDAEKVQEMMTAETWLTAAEAKENGFVDEITDAVEMKMDASQGKLFVNKLSVDIKNYDGEKLRRVMEVNKVEEKNFFDKLTESIANALTPKAEEKTPTVEEKSDVAKIRQQELERIRGLQSLKSTNAAANALIDLAVERGDTVDEIQPYLNAVKNVKAETAQDIASKIVAVIRDQMTSGAEKVQGGQKAPTDEDIQAAQAQRVIDFANGMV